LLSGFSNRRCRRDKAGDDDDTTSFGVLRLAEEEETKTGEQ
jgi:hypothetical protein